MKNITRVIALIMCAVLFLSANIAGVQAATVTVPATEKLTATATADTVKLSWKKVSKATGYRVYRVVDGKLKAIKTLKANKYTVESLTASETYKFAVKTYITKSGKTYWSSKYKTVTVKTKAMAKPQKPKATAAKNAVTLNWSKVAGATGYNVYQYKSGNWVKVKTVTTNTAKITSLKVDTTYKFKIRPYAATKSGKVWGKYSDAVSAKTVDKTKAKFKTPIISSKSVVLIWESVPEATGYRIRMMKNGSWVVAADGIRDTSLYVAGLSSDTEYTFQVVGYKVADGKTTWFTRSDPLTFKTIGTTTTTKPTTTQPTTQPTTNTTTTTTTTQKPTDSNSDESNAYRLKKYKQQIEKEELYFEIDCDYGDGQLATVEFARKNGDMYMKTSAEGLSMKISYLKADDDMAAYVFGLKYQVPDEEKAEMMSLMTEMIELMNVNIDGEITVAEVVFNGKNVVRESYVDSKTGYTMNYYFDGDKLVGIKKAHKTYDDEIVYVKEISNSVNNKYFDRKKIILL